ncbi:MAG TPA: amino acid ABC transporter substrate-binding protein, partial [Actinobacteria bacterium]|nr:amino acid ABC transporter substrate-binding protein [Actinomycetota bacterium]
MKRLYALITAVTLVLTACSAGATPATTTTEAPSAEPSVTTTAADKTAVPEPILIGFAGDFSDIYSFYDSPVREGAELAVAEINAAGGVLGRPLEFVARDGRNNQDETMRATQELIDQGAAYLIGTSGDPFLAQASLACAAGIPISTGDGTAPTLVGDAGPCAFQTIMSDNLQGAVDAEYAWSQGYKTAYMLRSTEIPYTNDLPTYFAAAFEHAGGKILGEDVYRIDAGDYNVQVTAIAALDPAPDVIFTPMFIPDTPVFLRQLRAAGIEIPVLSTDGAVDASILEAGDAVEGLVATTHAWPADDNAMAKFYAKYKEATGADPESPVVAIG